jgi:MFS family permease
MIHGLLPVFLVTVIGASATTVGLIEGMGEGLALITRVFSGAVSDWLGKRKVLLVAGYLLATLTKPLFALAGGVGLVLTARLLDRFGKGLRGAPRDALVADLAPPEQRGAAFGLRQSLDSVGAFLGPLLAMVLMAVLANDFRAVFWLAVIPGAVAVTLLVTFIKEPAPRQRHTPRAPLHRAEIPRLGVAYWRVLGVGVVFTLARFSEAFLLLRAEDLGLAAGLVPLMLVILSLVYALGAYPIGHLSDRLGRHGLLLMGLGVLMGADLVLALASNIYWVSLGAALWGLHLAFTQGLFAALVADTAPTAVRGTAFGIYGLVTGIAILMASVFAGWLWDQLGPGATFIAGAVLAGLALMGFMATEKNKTP